jgi:hypothetical protein
MYLKAFQSFNTIPKQQTIAGVSLQIVLFVQCDLLLNE